MQMNEQERHQIDEERLQTAESVETIIGMVEHAQQTIADGKKEDDTYHENS